tara:strand:+ start:1493 stop:3052 length:1560 start_codon:yes stop_codon:yes gene_type:complete
MPVSQVVLGDRRAGGAFAPKDAMEEQEPIPTERPAYTGDEDEDFIARQIKSNVAGSNLLAEEMINRRIDNWRRENPDSRSSVPLSDIFQNEAVQALASQMVDMEYRGLTSDEIDKSVRDAPAPAPSVPVEAPDTMGPAPTVHIPPNREVLKLADLLEQTEGDLGVVDLSFEEVAAQEKADEEEATYQEIGQELKDFRIQPFRVYENTLFAVVAALASGLGAAAQSLTGGKNTALEMVMDAVNKDVDAQKAEYNALKDKAQVQHNVYGRAMNALGDAKKAYAVASKLGIETAYKRLEQSEKLYADNKQLQVTAQYQKGLLKNQADQISIGRKGKQTKQDTAKEQAAGSLKELKDMIGKWGELSTAQKTSGALAEMIGGITGRTFVTDEDAFDFFEERRSVERTLSFMAVTLLRASGEVGNLNEDEQRRFIATIRAAIPGWTIDTLFAGDEQTAQFEKNLGKMVTLLNLSDMPQFANADPQMRKAILMREVDKIRASIDDKRYEDEYKKVTKADRDLAKQR